MALPALPVHNRKDVGDLADEVDWSACFGFDPTVIGTTTGRLQTTWRYRCPDTEQMQPRERSLYLARVHEVLKLVPEGWAFEADWERLPAPPYPKAAWTQATHWLVDTLRAMDFEERPRFISSAHLTVSTKPPSRPQRLLQDLLLTKRAARADQQDLDMVVAVFQREAGRWGDLFRDQVLNVTPLDGDAMATYLARFTDWDRPALRTEPATGEVLPSVRMPATFSDLDHQLSSGSWWPGQPPLVHGHYIQPVTIKGYQPRMSVWLPESLAKLPFPLRYHVRWVPMSRKEADKWLYWQQKKWAGSDMRLAGMLKKWSGEDKNSGQKRRDERSDTKAIAASLEAVTEQVLTGEEVLGYLQGTVLVRAADLDTLDHRVRMVRTLLFSLGLVEFVEEAGASEQWLSTGPGHVHYGFRSLPMRTSELTGLLPHGDVWEGVPWNDHLKAPCLLVASTDATPFYLTTHVGENGNAMIVGPTRSGKSAIVGLMTRQWFRYPGARCCIWDRDYAHKAMTLLSGGIHYDLGAPGCSGFHPLARIDEQAERVWALDWLTNVLTDEGYPPDGEERQELWEALGALAGLSDPRARTLGLYRQMLQAPRLKVGLVPFCTAGADLTDDGPYSFFDAREDAFGLDARLVTFEMAHLFTQKRAIAPTLTYVFHRLESAWFDGSPVKIKVEEAKWLLGLDTFISDMEVWLKARLKMNVTVDIICQELVDMARTRAWASILNSVPTRFLLPNWNAGNEEQEPLYRQLGCQPHDIAIIEQSQRHRDYYYMSELGSRRFQLQLSKAERLLCAASDKPELKVLDDLVSVHTPETLPAAWLDYWGCHEEAAVLQKIQEEHDGQNPAVLWGSRADDRDRDSDWATHLAPVG